MHVNYIYFKLRSFYQTEFIVWIIQGLRHWVEKIYGVENQGLWHQRVNSFLIIKNEVVKPTWILYLNWDVCTLSQRSVCHLAKQDDLQTKMSF